MSPHTLYSLFNPFLGQFLPVPHSIKSSLISGVTIETSANVKTLVDKPGENGPSFPVATKENEHYKIQQGCKYGFFIMSEKLTFRISERATSVNVKAAILSMCCMVLIRVSLSNVLDKFTTVMSQK